MNKKPGDLEMRVASVLAAGLEPVPRPYLAASKAAGCSEEEFLAIARRLVKSGLVKRVAAVVNPRALGLGGAALVAWRVRPREIVRVGAMLAAEPNVTHCYARKSAPDWPYNLYTMAHGVDGRSVSAWAARAAKKTGATDYVVLATLEELKRAPGGMGKSSLKSSPAAGRPFSDGGGL